MTGKDWIAAIEVITVGEPQAGADGAVRRNTLADCVPILYYDPRCKVIGIAHAGWKGTVLKVASAVIETMKSKYGTRPGDTLAAIGPSIGAHHYEVGPEVAERVKQVFGKDVSQVLHSDDANHWSGFILIYGLPTA